MSIVSPKGLQKVLEKFFFQRLSSSPDFHRESQSFFLDICSFNFMPSSDLVVGRTSLTLWLFVHATIFLNKGLDSVPVSVGV